MLSKQSFMTKIEYIRASHRQTNRKLREWLDGVYRKLCGRNRVLGSLWRVVAWIIYGVVYLVSWLAFVVTLFRDVKFTPHYMECEIGDLPPAEARQYLLARQQEYTRRLSYGSVPAKEQKRIDKTFEYLFAKYPAPAVPVEEALPDPAAVRHAQIIETITEVKTVMAGVADDFDRKGREDAQLWEQKEERHSQMLANIAEVKMAVDSVVTYTDRKDHEDAERQKREAEQLAAADKRRERHLSRSGFEHNPDDFSPKYCEVIENLYLCA